SHGQAHELTRTALDGARLVGAVLRQAHQCSFRGTDLSEAQVQGGCLVRCDLTGARLAKAQLYGAKAADSVFRTADLQRAGLVRSHLAGADFREADLSGADLTESDLTGAALAGARLKGADLTKAKLARADLRGADLREANLAGASLVGARVDGADFTGANLNGTSLRGLDRTKAKGLEAARPVMKAGPHLRRLEEVARQCRRLETFAALDLTDGPVKLRIIVREGWQKVWTDTQGGGTLDRGVAGALGEALLDLTRKGSRGA